MSSGKGSLLCFSASSAAFKVGQKETLKEDKQGGERTDIMIGCEKSRVSWESALVVLWGFLPTTHKLSRRVASYTQIRTCVLEVTRKV